MLKKFTEVAVSLDALIRGHALLLGVHVLNDLHIWLATPQTISCIVRPLAVDITNSNGLNIRLTRKGLHMPRTHAAGAPVSDYYLVRWAHPPCSQCRGRDKIRQGHSPCCNYRFLEKITPRY